MLSLSNETLQQYILSDLEHTATRRKHVHPQEYYMYTADRQSVSEMFKDLDALFAIFTTGWT